MGVAAYLERGRPFPSVATHCRSKNHLIASGFISEPEPTMSQTTAVEQRRDLAAALRLGAMLGWQSGICNHFSFAVDDERFLINPQGRHWSEVTASSLLMVDRDGKVIEGDGEVETSAFYIHYNIHRNVPAARCVLHAHPRFATALTCIENGRLEYSHQDSLRFYDRIAYDDDFNGAVREDNEGERIARQLGNRSIMMMAHHGITVIGDTVGRAYNDFYYLEKACEYQVTAMSTGGRLRVLDDETCRTLAPAFMEETDQVREHFVALKRVLERDQPDYLN